MLVTTKAIVIATFKYADSGLVVKCLTETDGLKSYLIKSGLSSKKGILKKGYFQPMTLLEITSNHKNRGTLEFIKEAKIDYPYQTVSGHLHKSAIAIFISEVLNNILYEEQENKSMFHFVRVSLLWLDTHESVANFHLAFLAKLTGYLGFYPDESNLNLPFFNLKEGSFTYSNAEFCLNEEDTGLFKQVLASGVSNCDSLKLKKDQRAALLKHLLLYYQLHLPKFNQPRSLDVLNEVYSSL